MLNVGENLDALMLLACELRTEDRNLRITDVPFFFAYFRLDLYVVENFLRLLILSPL